MLVDDDLARRKEVEQVELLPAGGHGECKRRSLLDVHVLEVDGHAKRGRLVVRDVPRGVLPEEPFDLVTGEYMAVPLLLDNGDRVEILFSQALLLNRRPPNSSDKLSRQCCHRGKHCFDVPDRVGESLLRAFLVALERGNVVGVDAAAEADLLQFQQNLEHVHVAIVEQRLLERARGGQAAADIAQVNHEDFSLAAVVVDFVQHQRAATGLASRPAAVEVADLLAWKGIDDPMEAETAERGVDVRSIGRMDGELDLKFFDDGYELAVGETKTLPPEIQIFLRRRLRPVFRHADAFTA